MEVRGSEPRKPQRPDPCYARILLYYILFIYVLGVPLGCWGWSELEPELELMLELELELEPELGAWSLEPGAGS